MAHLFSQYSLIDLTHTLHPAIPTWTGECGFKSTIQMDYREGARVLQYECEAGIGTHIDAPLHFIPDGREVDQLTLEELCTEVFVVDLSSGSQITVRDCMRLEEAHGRISKGSVVVGNTGWSRYWSEPERYRTGSPSFHPDVGEFLLERDVAGIGIDTLSPDPYGGEYPLHHQLLGAGKFILENLTNLDQLPKKGALLIALPLKIAGGAESPVRAIALINKF